MPERSSKKKRKRPADINRLAKSIVDDATGEPPPAPDDGKDPAAVALGRKGGAEGRQGSGEDAFRREANNDR